MVIRMFETNLTDIVNQSETTIHFVVNGTFNATEPLDLQVFGAIPPVQVPYIDLVFQLELIQTIAIIFITFIVFLILIKRGRVVL